MNTILVLVDFSSTSQNAYYQALQLGKKNSAKVIAVHISNESDSAFNTALEQLSSDLESKSMSAGVSFEFKLVKGDLFIDLSGVLRTHNPDLILVGTHGKNGLKQNLFGSNIYKLLGKVDRPVVVVKEDTQINSGEFNKVLMPVSAHANFMTKVKQTAQVLSDEGMVTIFAINVPGVELSSEIQGNVKAAKSYFEENGIQNEYVEKDSRKFSVGYSKETLDFVEGKDYDLISILTETSQSHSNASMVMDKENVILNDYGIAVLCSND